jgi:hypothetical protein
MNVVINVIKTKKKEKSVTIGIKRFNFKLSRFLLRNIPVFKAFQLRLCCRESPFPLPTNLMTAAI